MSKLLSTFADTLTASIDDITRRWVDQLRHSNRTEIHKQLLTSEIVNGVKAMLACLAAAIDAQEEPTTESSSGSGASDVAAGTRQGGTRPLGPSLSRAQQSAQSHGLLRHAQGAELHEIFIEYSFLRELIGETIVMKMGAARRPDSVPLLQYVNRLVDELMLTSVESFYNAAVRDLERRAVRDPHTQLYNKDYFIQRLNQEMRRAVRHREPLTVAMIDMDLLKQINDTYGHPTGDAVIAAISSTIRRTCRHSDVPCRYGGDEFAVILPETGKAEGQMFATRLLSGVEQLRSVVTGATAVTTLDDKLGIGLVDAVEGKVPLVAPVPTISVGLASYPEDARNPETLLAKADAALYRAKREGRNRIAT